MGGMWVADVPDTMVFCLRGVQVATDWRQLMSYFTVRRFRECVALLQVTAAGYTHLKQYVYIVYT